MIFHSTFKISLTKPHYLVFQLIEKETWKAVRSEAKAASDDYKKWSKSTNEDFRQWLKGIREETLPAIDISQHASSRREMMDKIYLSYVRSLPSNKVEGQPGKKQIPQEEEEYELAVKDLREVRNEAKKEITDLEQEYLTRQNTINSALLDFKSGCESIDKAKNSFETGKLVFKKIVQLDPAKTPLETISQAKKEMNEVDFNTLDEQIKSLEGYISHSQALAQNNTFSDIEIFQKSIPFMTKGLENLTALKQKLGLSLLNADLMVKGMLKMAKANSRSNKDLYDETAGKIFQQGQQEVQNAKNNMANLDTKDSNTKQAF